MRHGDIRQKLPDTPERFDTCVNVLGKKGFSSGRCYFEVQVKLKTKWYLGVARESINRKERIRRTPSNGYWTMGLRNRDEYKACDDPRVSLSLRVKPQRVVCLWIMRRVWSPFMMWSPALISTLSLLSLSLKNSIHYLAHP